MTEVRLNWRSTIRFSIATSTARSRAASLCREASLDLHGMTLAAAERAVRGFLANAWPSRIFASC